MAMIQLASPSLLLHHFEQVLYEREKADKQFRWSYEEIMQMAREAARRAGDEAEGK